MLAWSIFMISPSIIFFLGHPCSYERIWKIHGEPPCCASACGGGGSMGPATTCAGRGSRSSVGRTGRPLGYDGPRAWSAALVIPLHPDEPDVPTVGEWRYWWRGLTVPVEVDLIGGRSL